MPLTNAGRNHIASDLTNLPPVTKFDATNARIGVGDSTTVFAASQTDLLGTNKFRKGMDATYPTLLTNIITFRATFTTAEANFAWQEWGVFNAASGGTMLNRKVESLGTKPSNQSWQLTVTITINAA